MRQINFPFDGLPNEFSVTYTTELLLPFIAEYAKRVPFTYEEQEEFRKLLFSMGHNHNLLHFPVSQRTFKNAILGVVDPYTLGALDSMSLDFKMWPDFSGLVPDGDPGVDGTSIFSFIDPLYYLFWYNTKYHGQFNLGDFVVDESHIIAKTIYLLLRNEPKLAALSAEKMAVAAGIYIQLSAEKSKLISEFMLYCKSILGNNWTLGEMDPFTLGYYDPMALWQLSGQAATALRITTASALSQTAIEPKLTPSKLVVRTATAAASEDIVTNVSPISKRLMSPGYRRRATLGDMDEYAFETLDTRILGMYFYGKTPAIVTAES